MLATIAGSICAMKNNTHFVVPKRDFELLEGQDSLTLYQVRCTQRLWFCLVSKVNEASKSGCGTQRPAIRTVCFVPLQFNTKQAKHYFCKICGICSFYIPRSDPDGYAVTVACLDPGTMERVEVEGVDGQNWEKVFSEQAAREAQQSVQG